MHFAKYAMGPLVLLQIWVTDTNWNHKPIYMRASWKITEQR